MMDWERPGYREPRLPAPRDGWWQIVGTILAVIVGLAGVAYVAFAALVVVSFNSYGSNK